MGVLPRSQSELIEFGELHGSAWDGSPTTLGLTSAQVTAIKNATDAARAAYNDTLAAREAAKASTITSDAAIGAMRVLLARAVEDIRMYAETTGNVNVYASAQIPPPAPPVAALPPSQPVMMRAAIEPTGALTISWKPAPSSTGFNSTTSRVSYTVSRRLATTGAFTIIGTTPAGKGGRRGYSQFTDASLPASAASGPIQYRIQGTRMVTGTGTNLDGPVSETFVVMVGVGDGGLPFVMSESVQHDGDVSVRRAA